MGDYDGLSLFVSAKGSKAWHFRYHWLGKQSRMSLGMYPELRQHKMLIRRKCVRVDDLPPYIVPLSIQAQAVVRELLDDFKPAQKYLFASVVRWTNRMSENTVNFALKRMGYDRRLTGHGLRATMSTALNEIGYPRVWVDAQLSHADPNRISAIYNHAQYVEQGRVMMQDWANRLDFLEQSEVEAASRHLIVHLQGVSEMAWQGDRTPQRLGAYASHPMEACWQQAMLGPTADRNVRIAMHAGSDMACSL